jgi:quinol monooxygenase YgiN
MAVISITRLRVRSWRFLPLFFIHALRSARQAGRAEGNLGSSLLRDRKNTFWTATAWRDEAAMRQFMLSGAHRQAMPKLLNWCDEAALVHWTQDSADLPSWPAAHARLEAEGRSSKVYHPSENHKAHKFPAPR